MSEPEQWEVQVAPWRVVSTLITLVQSPAMFAAMVLAIFFSSSHGRLAYLATGVFVVCELAQWALARVAVRRTPGIPFDEVYASRPLKQTDRNIVLINLALLPAGAVLFLAMNDVAVVTKVVLATVLGSAMAMLLRVWRRGSWLAVTHLPAKPRRTAG
jgi:hypothetical protein